MADFGKVGVQPETPETRVETPQSHKSFNVGAATALLALSLVAGQAGAGETKSEGIKMEEQVILLAQAAETDGKVYTVEVVQVDGTKRKVSYQKYKDGVIIPPELTDGKLVDGSPATSNPKLNIGKNRSILARYDKDSRVLLAVVDKNDILGKARRDIDVVIKKAENAELISKQEFLNGLTGIYVITLGGVDMSKAISGIETVGRVQLKLSPSDIASIKSEAQKRANESWKSVTGGATA